MIPKFRVWNKKTESFINYGDLMLDLKNGKVYAGDVGMPEYTIDVTKQVVLMQSTGLEDKNGVDIYEGDIVEIKQQGSIDKYIPNNSVNEIVYKDSAFCVKETWGIGGIEWPIIAGLYYKASEEFEVLGNIYENPELLEVAK